MKTRRKTLAFLLTLAMVLSMGVTAFAAGAGDYLGGTAVPPSSDPDCSTVLVSQPTASTSVSVTLIMEAGDAVEYYMPVEDSGFYKEVDVTLESSEAKTFTVTDLLDQVDGTSGLVFKTTNGQAFTSASDYLEQVIYSGTTWDDGQWGFDGWVFRINDKFPVRLTADGLGYEGTSILQTYLKDGDVVHFFYDFPSDFDPDTGSVAADYVRGVVQNYTEASLTVQMQGHDTYIEPVSPYVMSVNKYYNLGQGVAVELYSASGVLLAQGTTGTDGTVTFTGSFAAGQAYIVKSASAMYVPTEDWEDFITNVYFDLTSAYSKVVL